MIRRIIIMLILSFPVVLNGQENKVYSLPTPHKEGGMPLMEALSKRSSSRQFLPQKLTKEQLSDLLWAANGINRTGSGKRTAPSAKNDREIDIYMIMKEGVFLYQPESHTLKQLSDYDISNYAGTQKFVRNAPVNLLFVADYSRTDNPKAEKTRLYAWANAGFISQNIYLYCASAGLATVVRDYVDREKLKELLKLNDQQEIILGQTVGYGM